jgi:mono/diheme cytochrome c family protein
MTLTLRRVTLGALVAFVASNAAAQDKVTYYENVAPIFPKNCVSCHQPAGANIGSLVAPMSLSTFDETRPWVRAIARKVQAREMPPWFADAPKGVFTNERGLSDQEIRTILAWVDAGAPAGDKAKAPLSVQVAPTEGGYALGKPDLIVKMQPYFVNDEAQDVQGTFAVTLTDEMLPKDVVVRAWEFRAGTYLAGRDTVHHMCGGIREPGEQVVDLNDGEAAAASLGLGCIAGGAEPQCPTIGRD